MSREFQITILDLLGIDTSKIPDGAEIKYGLQNAPQSWEVFILLGVAALLIYGAVHLYLRELNTCPKRVAVALALTRVTVLSLLLFAIFLGPAVSYSRRRVIEPYVLVLIDNSASIGHRDYYLDDRYSGPVVAAGISIDGDPPLTIEQIREIGLTRADLLNDLLTRDDEKFFKDIESKGSKVKIIKLFEPREKVELSTADDSTADDSTGSDPAADDSRSDDASRRVLIDTAPGTMGKRTHLARAIREAIASVAGSPIAGIILITDGQDNAKGDDPVAAAEYAAQRTRNKKKGGVRIFPLAVGDASPPRNLQVVELNAKDYVWKGDPFEIGAILSADGLGDQSFQVELYERLIEREGGQPGEDQKRLIETKTVPLPANTPVKVTFNRSQNVLGRYAYHVRVKPLEHESRDDDNERQIQVHVRDNKSRVLLIAGGPQWDYRLLQAMLTRDDEFDLSVWLQSMDANMAQEGNTRITKLPYLKKDLEKYDVIMMFDPDPAEFNTQWIETLSEHVDDGGGLLFMAGPKYSSKFLADFRTRSIRDLLPVRLGDVAQADIEQFSTNFTRAWPLRVVPENLDRPIMRFTTDTQFNTDIWQNMPGVYWSFPAAKAHQGARVLLEHSSNDPQYRRGESYRPLLVTGEPGAGRVVYMGFNGTWRWRRMGNDAEFYDKFWIQTVRYLVEGRMSKSRRRGVIDTGGRQFNVGEKITVRAKLRDRARDPLIQPVVTARLRGPNATSSIIDVPLTAVEGRPGQYVGSVRATLVGQNQIWVDLEGDQPGETIRVPHEFNVIRSQVEMRDLTLNRALLEHIAKVSAGEDEAAREKARVYDVHELDQIVADLPDRRETIVTTGPWMKLWDNGFTLLLLVGLLSIEWAVRKHYKLM